MDQTRRKFIAGAGMLAGSCFLPKILFGKTLDDRFVDIRDIFKLRQHKESDLVYSPPCMYGYIRTPTFPTRKSGDNYRISQMGTQVIERLTGGDYISVPTIPIHDGYANKLDKIYEDCFHCLICSIWDKMPESKTNERKIAIGGDITDIKDDRIIDVTSYKDFFLDMWSDSKEQKESAGKKIKRMYIGLSNSNEPYFLSKHENKEEYAIAVLYNKDLNLYFM